MKMTSLLHKGGRFNYDNQGGFTLIELIVTLIIAAILITQGVPAFVTTIKNSRLAAETNKLVADVNLARSEAIKRGLNTVVCSTANPSAAAPGCANSSNWGSGWLVFADENGNDDYDDGTDTLVRVGLGADGTVTIVSSSNSLTYTSDGLISAAAATAIAVCDDRGGSVGNQIQINPTGRPRMIKGDAGTPITCNAPAAL